MILKLIFIQTSYIILTLTCIDTYVLFAANIDDFRSIAKKIIPGKLADQLADMASKSSKDYYRIGSKPDEYKDSDDTDSNDSSKEYKEYNSQNDDSKDDDNSTSEEESGSDFFKPIVDPAVEKSNITPPKKRYAIKNQVKNIDLDELVKRVKEKLEKEYKISTQAPMDEEPTVETTNKIPNIEDYYYKDDKLNINFDKEDEYEEGQNNSPMSLVFSTENPNFVSPDSNEADTPQYIEENVKESEEFTEENAKLEKNNEGDIKQVFEDNTGNVNEVSVYDNKQNVRKITEYKIKNAKDVVRYGEENKKHGPAFNADNQKEVAQYDDYKGETIKDVPVYYEDNAKSVEPYNDGNDEDAGDYKGETIKDAPEYYEDNTKAPVVPLKGSNVKAAIDYKINTIKAVSHYYKDNTKKVIPYSEVNDEDAGDYKGETIKDAPEYYEDNTKAPVVPIKGSNVKEALNIGNNNVNDEDYKGETVKDAPEYYEDNVKDAEPTVGNGELFKEIDMHKSNDSYEDYVIPKKDDIFDSIEVTTKNTLKPIMGVQKFTVDNSKYRLNRPKAVMDPVTRKVEENNVVSPPPKQVIIQKKRPLKEIKAKTESLWYKDPNIENYDDSTKSTTQGVGPKTTKKRVMGTMIPTRAHVKISSPNYFASLPAVAEKYNFDEPLPEKDREPENIKHIGNPPARINMKVKI